MASEWEVVRWTASWPWPPDRSFTEARLLADQPQQGMAASILRDGAAIGLASVSNGTLGYMLAQGAWGQGYATEACAALIRFAFETTDWPAIEAAVFKGNSGSMRVLDKLGFEVTGAGASHGRAVGRDLQGIHLRRPRPFGLNRPT